MFDPYHKWLGILPKDQPPNHYRLLGVEALESDLEVIEGAADRAMAFIRQYQSGEHAALAAKLLNEIATARLCLLKPKAKAAYDADLKKEFAGREVVSSENVSFDFASELPDVAPSETSPPKRKPKKGNSPQPLWIAGGVAVCLLIGLVLFLNRGGQAPKQTQPIGRDVAETKPVPTVTESIAGVEPPATNALVTAPMTKVASPIDTTPAQEASGPTIDLLQSVDFSRDKVAGEWKKEGTTLIGGPGGKLYLPGKLPDDYQLKFVVKRLSGNDGFGIGFVCGGHIGEVGFDGYYSTISGLILDGQDGNNNCTTRPGALFRQDRSSSILVTVHPGHVHAAFDGQTIIDWHGNPERLACTAMIRLQNRETSHISVAPVTTYQIELAEMTPLLPEANRSRPTRLESPVDIMPMLDTSRDVKSGQWTVTGGALRTEDGWARIELPVVPPDEYTLSARIERPAGSGGESTLTFGLVAGDSPCQIVVFNGAGLGLDMIDGQRWHQTDTYGTGNQLKPGESANVAFTVTKAGIRYDFNGRTLINWQGDFQRLSLSSDYYLADARALNIGTLAKYVFRDLKIGPPVGQPRAPIHPPITASAPLDLLALVDAKRDALLGTWVKDDTALRVMGDIHASKLTIPCEVPSEYKLTLKVARETGGLSNNEALILKLPIGDSMAEVILDGRGSTVNGIFVDYLPIDDSRNASSRAGQTIPPGATQNMTIYVRQTGIKMTSGEKTILEFHANSSRLSATNAWTTPQGRIGIVSSDGRFRIEKLEIESLEPTTFPSVPELDGTAQVLPMIDPQRDSRRGQWKMSADRLISPIIPSARIRIPAVVPDRYELAAIVERKMGAGDFFVGLVVDGRACTAGFDGAQGTVASLMHLDGAAFYDPVNPMYRKYAAPLFPQGQAVILRCFVLPDTVVVACDEKEVLRWHGDARRFAYRPEYGPPNYTSEDRDHLFFGSSDSEFVIREVHLKALDDDKAKRIEEEFAGVFPLASQVNVPLAAAPVWMSTPDIKSNEKMPKNAPPTSAAKSKLEVGANQPLLKGKWIDLLEMVQLPEHAQIGTWERRESSLICEPAQDARFMVPIALRGSYELKCEFTRGTGDEHISIVFPVGLTACSMGLSLNRGGISGFNSIDGVSPDQLPVESTAAVRPGALVNGKRYQLQIEIVLSGERATLKTTLDGQRLTVWQGNWSRLSNSPYLALPCLQSIGVIASHSSTRIHKLELRMKNDAKGFVLGSDWKNSLSEVNAAPNKDVVANCADWNGKKYFISDKPMSFPSAQLLAAQLHGRLLTISSDDEVTFVCKRFNEHDCWTSAWRRQQGQEWRDERNRPLRFLRWHNGEPTMIPRELTAMFRASTQSGLCDVSPWSEYYACIEWGEEYSDEQR